MLTQRTLSFFGQALNNTSEHSEVSLLCAVTRSFTYVQDDSSANFDCLWVNCYIVTSFNSAEGILCALYL